MTFDAKELARLRVQYNGLVSGTHKTVRNLCDEVERLREELERVEADENWARGHSQGMDAGRRAGAKDAESRGYAQGLAAAAGRLKSMEQELPAMCRAGACHVADVYLGHVAELSKLAREAEKEAMTYDADGIAEQREVLSDWLQDDEAGKDGACCIAAMALDEIELLRAKASRLEKTIVVLTGGKR